MTVFVSSIDVNSRGGRIVFRQMGQNQTNWAFEVVTIFAHKSMSGLVAAVASSTEPLLVVVVAAVEASSLAAQLLVSLLVVVADPSSFRGSLQVAGW